MLMSVPMVWEKVKHTLSSAVERSSLTTGDGAAMEMAAKAPRRSGARRMLVFRST